MSPEPLAATVLGASLVAYVLTGLADFGGGVWDLVAQGPRAPDQRRVIARAIGPIWEANHVWLILALVVTFVCFPLTFATISTALHIPLSIMLIGTVVRGAAFAFRAYDSRREAVQLRWSRAFAAGSLVAPVALGIVVGSLSSGDLSVVRGQYVGGYFDPWMKPFPWAVGGLTLAIGCYLSAVYLTLDTRDDAELQELFRRRGLFAGGAVFALAWTAFSLARTGAPVLWEGLWASAWAWPFQLVVATVGLGTLSSLALRRWQAARVLAAAQTVLVIVGWGASLWPFTVPPDLTVYDAAPPSVIWAALSVMALGAVPLFVAYGWLMHVFGKDAP